MSSAEEDKALVRRFVEEVLNGGNLDAIDELMAPDYLDHTVPQGKCAGREGLKRSLAKQLASSSNLRFDIEEQIAEGDLLICGGGLGAGGRYNLGNATTFNGPKLTVGESLPPVQFAELRSPVS